MLSDSDPCQESRAALYDPGSPVAKNFLKDSMKEFDKKILADMTVRESQIQLQIQNNHKIIIIFVSFLSRQKVWGR